MRIQMRWASPPAPPPPPPPDLQSSTSTLRALHHANYPSLLPSTKSPISFQQVDDDDEQLILIGDVKEHKAAVQENMSRVAGTNRRSYWNPSAETSAESSLSSSLSHQQQQGGGHWLEEDKILPFKKRRILNLNYVPSNNTRTIVKNRGNARASRKCTKKIWADHVVNYKDDGLEWAGGAGNMNNISTASCSSQRCRRINGHGWRCSQPSLVGYSMCEHHWELDRNRVTKKKKKKKRKKINYPCNPARPKFDQHHKPTSIEDFDDEHVISKRRIVTKARSLSSLLS